MRTSGPVKAHLTPGPVCILMLLYGPRAGADNLWGQMLMSRKSLSLCPFVASFKTISLKYDL